VVDPVQLLRRSLGVKPNESRADASALRAEAKRLPLKGASAAPEKPVEAAKKTMPAAAKKSSPDKKARAKGAVAEKRKWKKAAATKAA
jgi:hypothetical protein